MNVYPPTIKPIVSETDGFFLQDANQNKSTPSVSLPSIAVNRGAANETRISSNDDFYIPTIVPTRPILSLPVKRLEKDIFRVLQKWEGYVIDVGSDTFTARLVPIKGEGHDQEAEIYLEEVKEEDRRLITPGAVFYWSIGYHDKPSGRTRASIIRLRRIPSWTKRELEAARAKASKLKELFDAE